MCLISSLLEFFCLCVLKHDWASLVAQMVKTPPEMQEPWVLYIYIDILYIYIFLDSIYLHVLKEFSVNSFQLGNPAIFLFLVLVLFCYQCHMYFIRCL